MIYRDFITVIVPAYNAETTIGKCLDSLIGAPFPTIEIIVINDGSTDSTQEILNAYANKDARISVITTKNIGPAAARNIGIRAARGSYITFCDSDDWVDSNKYAKVLRRATKHDADIYIFGYRNIRDHLTITHSHYRQKRYESSDYAEATLLDSAVNGFVWNKIYNKKLLLNRLLDEERNICEDLCFNYEIARDNPTLNAIYLPYTCYNYDLRRTSLTRESDIYLVVREAIASLLRNTEASNKAIEAAMYALALKQMIDDKPYKESDLAYAYKYWISPTCPNKDKLKMLIKVALSKKSIKAIMR